MTHSSRKRQVTQKDATWSTRINRMDMSSFRPSPPTITTATAWQQATPPKSRCFATWSRRRTSLKQENQQVRRHHEWPGFKGILNRRGCRLYRRVGTDKPAGAPVPQRRPWRRPPQARALTTAPSFLIRSRLRISEISFADPRKASSRSSERKNVYHRRRP